MNINNIELYDKSSITKLLIKAILNCNVKFIFTILSKNLINNNINQYISISQDQKAYFERYPSPMPYSLKYLDLAIKIRDKKKDKIKINTIIELFVIYGAETDLHISNKMKEIIKKMLNNIWQR